MGSKRTINLALGQSGDNREVEVDLPAGIENGAQLLMQDVVRSQQHRVSLVVQVRFLIPLCCAHSLSKTPFLGLKLVVLASGGVREQTPRQVSTRESTVWQFWGAWGYNGLIICMLRRA